MKASDSIKRLSVTAQDGNVGTRSTVVKRLLSNTVVAGAVVLFFAGADRGFRQGKPIPQLIKKGAAWSAPGRRSRP